MRQQKNAALEVYPVRDTSSPMFDHSTLHQCSAEHQRRGKRNLRFYFTYKALLGGFGFSFPALFDLYRACGMQNGRIAYLQAIFAAALAVLGLCGGYFADRLTRRAALTIGLLLHVVGEVAYGTGQSFGGLVFAEILLALALALMGGAERAILYEWLLEMGREDEHPKMQSYGMLAFFLAVALSGIAGALIMQYNARLPFFIAASCSGLGLCVALKFKEPSRSKARGRLNHLKEFGRIGREAFGKAELRWLLLFAGLLLAFTQAGWPLFQPYYVEQGVRQTFFGVIIAVQNVFAALTVIASPWLERRAGRRSAFMLIAITVSSMYLLMGVFPSRYAVATVFLGVWVRSFADVVFVDYLNRSIGSEHRATINSLMGFVSRSVYALLLIPLGAVAQTTTVAHAFVALGVLTALVSLLLIIFMPRHKNGEVVPMVKKEPEAKQR